MAPKKAKGHRATACLLITDTHFDEDVDPAQVDGINAYDRTIAEVWFDTEENAEAAGYQMPPSQREDETEESDADDGIDVVAGAEGEADAPNLGDGEDN